MIAELVKTVAAKVGMVAISKVYSMLWPGSVSTVSLQSKVRRLVLCAERLGGEIKFTALGAVFSKETVKVFCEVTE